MHSFFSSNSTLHSFIYYLYNSKVMPIEEHFLLLWLDGEAWLCVMGEVGGGKKELIIMRRQAKPSGEMKAMIVASVQCKPEWWGVWEKK
jgi:hypothetical protein